VSYTNAEKLRELEREIGYREKVFTRMVAEGLLDPNQARRRMSIMREIAADYVKLVEQDEPRLTIGD